MADKKRPKNNVKALPKTFAPHAGRTSWTGTAWSQRSNDWSAISTGSKTSCDDPRATRTPGEAGSVSPEYYRSELRPT